MKFTHWTSSSRCGTPNALSRWESIAGIVLRPALHGTFLGGLWVSLPVFAENGSIPLEGSRVFVANVGIVLPAPAQDDR